MDSRVREHLEHIRARDDRGNTALIDIVREYGYDNEVHKEHLCARRWWDEWLHVVDVDGMLIGYEDATTSGDMSPEERGYCFDPSGICEMRATEKTVVVYESVKAEE